MQRYCTELTEKLLKSLDKEYNVVDMGAVVDVITALEKTTITKEVLEITRLGKYINELRRKTNNDALAKRAKDLVRRWRDMVLPSAHSTPQPTPADPAPPALNGAKPHSPALRGLKPQSPALRGLKPQSPLIRDTTPLRVLSTSLSVHSDHSRSPNITPNKQTVTATSNHRLSPGVSPKLGPATQNYSTEAVPRTHSSNKRLRKDDSENQQHHQQQQHHSTSSITQYEPAVKRQRLNGENVSGSLNSQVPSPTLKERISVQFVDSSTEPDGEFGPKKRGRKKGSKSIKKQPFVEDRVKEKLASISRNPKLKTTQELLADLQARGSNSSSVNLDVPPSQGKEPPSTEDILRSSSDEQVSKYLHSGQNDTSSRRSNVAAAAAADKASQNRLKHGDNGHSKASPSSKHRESDVADSERLDSKSQESPAYRRQILTVEEILAKLPPLDLNAINWNDSDDGREEEEEEDDSAAVRPPQEVTAEDLERLHTQCIEGLNGNYQPKLSSLTNDVAAIEKVERVMDLRDTDTSACRSKNNDRTDEEFREWHELLARPSYDGQILHILPYVIID